MCGGMEFLMCKHTFDLNILQSLPKYSWHDVCEPDDLHDDLQRRQGTEASVFSTRRIQSELNFNWHLLLPWRNQDHRTWLFQFLTFALSMNNKNCS
jgi:hypothetical protein